MIKVYGGVIVNGKELLNEEIATLNPNRGWVYGLHWIFAGTQGFEEADIYAENNGIVFKGGYGKDALKNFFLWYAAQTSVL